MTSIQVVSCVGFASLQDEGRRGVAHLAVPTGGAFDRASFSLANRILGNSPRAAAVESCRAQLVFVANTNCEIAVTGAPVSIQVAGYEQAMNEPLFVRKDVVVAIQPSQLALRTYIAIRGGFDVEPVMGSRSFDELARLGPRPLAQGDSLPIGNDSVSDLPNSLGPVRGVSLSDSVTLRVWRGPRWDWFGNASSITSANFVVTSKLNRVGVRLDGHSFTWDTTRRLASEGVAMGSIQVPVDGVPLIFGPDHPTTAGYPVIGIVDPRDMSTLAQVTPGTRIRFALES